jgi:ubiquitin C-terminal hydrolase
MKIVRFLLIIIHKKNFILERTEQNLPPIASRSTLGLTTTIKDDLNNRTNLIPSQFKTLHLNTTHDFSLKQKLPPISNVSLSSPSDHQDNSYLLLARHTPGLCGLNNIGNTCFMNSAIQCLNSIPDLTKWVMEQTPSLTYRNVIDVYISLVQSMWSGRHACVTPRELKEYVSRSAPIFSDYGQKDSHEFMNSLLNAIQNVGSNSFLVNLFQIHIQSKTTCNERQHIDTTDETTTFLPLPIPDMKPYDNTNILLEDLIKDFCREDELDGQYYCQKCNICLSARHKSTIIQPLPRVLIIQLKRFPFDGTNRKIDTFVQYKLEHRNLLSDNDKYELYAVSMHSGNLAGGHYTTIARNYITKKWYRFDDSYVKEIDLKNVLSPFNARQAYVLIYLKQDD